MADLLRHDKDYAFDEYGWREVEDLILNMDLPCHYSIIL